MDPTRFVVTFAVLLTVIGIGRFVLTTVGRTADGMATLFVPPDRALGWPRGVQESDEPWGWHEPATTRRDDPIAGFDGDDGPPARPPDASGWTDPPPGTFVVPVDRVGPVHLGGRPH